MASELEKRELEIACQQILLTDASVYSVQWLEIPARYAAGVSAPLLLDHYFRTIRGCTCQLIRPVIDDTGVHFRLLTTSFALLSFSPAEFSADGSGEAVNLSISGGLLVQAGECDRGSFSIICQPGQDLVRITVQLSDFCPLLLGSRSPSRIRKLLYRLTQAYIHKVVTVSYLSSLYRKLTGLKIRARVKKVQVREGTDI